ncbi:MAG: SpoIIE family protein phosphatase [bacterium]|nr:SpoIIE family protein phosphatase [bacterium]
MSAEDKYLPSSEKLRHKISNLKKLIAVGGIINSTLDISELLDRAMKVAENIMNVEASALMLIDENTDELVFKIAHGDAGEKVKEIRLKKGQGIAGWVAKEEKPLVINDVENDSRHFKGADARSGFKTRAILCVPLIARNRTIGVLQVLNPISRKEFIDEDQELLESFSSMVAIAVENARMHKSLLEKQRVEHELEIGHQIQQNFLPSEFPSSENLILNAKNIPALELGGDFFDFLDFSEGKVGLVIGDVSGKGVPAALFMVRAMSEIRFHAALSKGVGELMGEINNALVDQSMMGMFITLLIGILDCREGIITFANAGHHPFLIRGKDGSVRETFCKTGLPAGIMPGVKYEESVAELKKGETIIGYTDGITEARSAKGEEFGEERLKNLIKHKKLDAGEIIQYILDDVEGFFRGVPQHDDLTLIAATVK